METIQKAGHTVARSRNLRGILDYARKSPLVSVKIAPHAGQGLLLVRYYDGAYSQTAFADFSVLVDWAKARRSWPRATTVTASQLLSELAGLNGGKHT
jgi:hypothetical protein